MKKVKFFIAVVTVTVIGASIFYACQKDNEEKSKSALKEELETLNNDVYSKMKTLELKQVEGWGKFWNSVGDFCQVLGADITGAAVGAGAVQGFGLLTGAATAGTGYIVVVGVAGTITGLGESHKEGKVVYGNGNASSGNGGGTTGSGNGGNSGGGNGNGGNTGGGNGNGGTGSGSGNESSAILGYSGYVHNKLLTEQFNQFGWKEFDKKELVQMVISEFDKEFYKNIKESDKDIIISTITSMQWSNIMEHIERVIAEAPKYEINENRLLLLLSYYNERRLINDNVFEVLASFFKVYSYIKDEKSLDITISSYVEFVENSTWLPEEDKYTLLVSLSVAYYTPYYWMQFTN